MSAELAIGTPETAVPAAAAVRPAPAAPPGGALLESHWRARLERVTELSLAYHDAEEARAGQPSARTPSGRPLLRQAVAQRRALAEIEAALARLGGGRFGRCARGGGVISATRLTRMPQARYCMSCETGADYQGSRQR